MNRDLQEILELARAARRQGQLSVARPHYREVASAGRDSGNKEALVAGLRGLGQVARDSGELFDSLNYYSEAAETARVLDDSRLLASTIRHLADIYRKSGELDAAEPLYIEALAAYRDNSRTTALELANAIRPFALLREAQYRFQDELKSKLLGPLGAAIGD